MPDHTPLKSAPASVAVASAGRGRLAGQSCKEGTTVTCPDPVGDDVHAPGDMARKAVGLDG